MPLDPSPQQPIVTPVGIDLGTTNSAVAHLDPTGKTVMIPNELGDMSTPSAVYFTQEGIIIGKEARKAIAFDAASVATAVKRDMGKSRYSRTMRGRDVPPEVLQAYLLQQLARDIDRQGLELPACVVTVPAYFDQKRRAATVNAAKVANLELVDTVNEPTAAALAFGEKLGYLSKEAMPCESMHVLVYDLGGGTFDVTVLELQPGDIRTLATDGDVRLGGLDWDRRLLEFAAQKFEDRFRIEVRDDAECVERLMTEAEQVKHTLSARDHTTFTVTYRDRSLPVDMTRETFQDITADLCERTRHTTHSVLKAAGIAWGQVGRVLLVGGATRMPMIREMLRRDFGRPVEDAVNPDEAVARGAAIFSGYQLAQSGRSVPLPVFRILDVASCSYGVEGIDLMTQRYENTILIARNTPLPATQSFRFVTKGHDQRSVVIKVLEGESSDPTACATIGKVVMKDLPAGLRGGHPIEVCCTCETNGSLHLECHLLGTDHQLSTTFQQEDVMDAAHVAQWRKIVSDNQ